MLTVQFRNTPSMIPHQPASSGASRLSSIAVSAAGPDCKAYAVSDRIDVVRSLPPSHLSRSRDPSGIRRVTGCQPPFAVSRFGSYPVRRGLERQGPAPRAHSRCRCGPPWPSRRWLAIATSIPLAWSRRAQVPGSNKRGLASRGGPIGPLWFGARPFAMTEREVNPGEQKIVWGTHVELAML